MKLFLKTHLRSTPISTFGSIKLKITYKLIYSKYMHPAIRLITGYCQFGPDLVENLNYCIF